MPEPPEAAPAPVELPQRGPRSAGQPREWIGVGVQVHCIAAGADAGQARATGNDLLLSRLPDPRCRRLQIQVRAQRARDQALELRIVKLRPPAREIRAVRTHHAQRRLLRARRQIGEIGRCVGLWLAIMRADLAACTEHGGRNGESQQQRARQYHCAFIVCLAAERAHLCPRRVRRCYRCARRFCRHPCAASSGCASERTPSAAPARRTPSEPRSNR